MRKIDIYLNGHYLCSTNRFKRCKDAVESVRKTEEVTVASCPSFRRKIMPTDIVRAWFAPCR